MSESRNFSTNFGYFIIIMLIGIVMAFVFGVIDDKTEIATKEVGAEGKLAAGNFIVSNKDGEFGKVSKSELENKITSTDTCAANFAGFRDEERLSLGLESSKCSSLVTLRTTRKSGMVTPISNPDNDSIYGMGVLLRQDAVFTQRSNLDEFSEPVVP